MADDALNPFVPRDAEARDQSLSTHFERLVGLALTTPDELQAATVFFNTGLSVPELHALRNNYDIEVIDVMMKAPQGTHGVVMSVDFGMTDLFAIHGSFEERLSFAISAEQKCFAKYSEHMPPDESAEWEELARRPFSVYSARIFGPNRSLRLLQDQPNVASVLLNVSNSVISEFEAARSYDGPHRYLMPGFHC